MAPRCEARRHFFTGKFMPQRFVHRALAVMVLAFVVAAPLAGPAWAAGDVKAGRHKALACQACHGLDGKAKIPDAPNLAGQNEFYLVKAVKDYRSGARKNDLMSLVAPNLKDQDIEDLAAYFAAIPVTVGAPPK